ncbi:hypothetical protein THASP1DRAFT_17465 [Thamnocephalis sphaerospora]|uniref:Major facilitator superfamily (MFS) profile domain-containing protein n=1 Tax=Thamnocephalis sphaerospora TaxID=78915 RepID=A0A4P9XMM1_9FUNG|nr:hypothetical protein THASP1DRAFT_17465 [Thamnocephalis sphaerospora]|eukprot:RKP07164.1 hypothetical protein THASP1DRAFT_17465 [Thamnocephalis sphaerospora]
MVPFGYASGDSEDSRDKHNGRGKDEDEDDEASEHISWYVLFVASLSAIGGFLFGYDTGIISGAMLFIQEEFALDTLQVEFVVGATTLGAIFGGLGAGFLSDRLGRRPVTLLSSIVFLAGALMMALAPGYGLLLTGRLVVGFGVGLASMVVPTYISEVSPKQYRGQLVTMNVLMITGGQLIAYCMSAALSNADHGWRIMFGLAAVPPIIQLIGMPFLPESPRYLLRRRRGTPSENRAAARRVLYRTTAVDPVDRELLAIEHAAEQTAGATYADLLLDPHHRRSLMVACGLQAFQQLSGFNTAMYYAASILRMSGFRDKQSAVGFSILVAGTNMLMTIVAIRYVDRVGRRRILLYTVAVTALALLLLGLAFAFLLGMQPYQADCYSYARCGACVADDRCAYAQDRCLPRNRVLLPDTAAGPLDSTLPQGSLQCAEAEVGSWLALAALLLYVAAYALGLGNVPWLIQSELFPLALRGRAGGLATSVNWVCNLAVAVSFLSLTHAITAAGTFWLYGGIVLVAWWFVWRCVPETAGRTLEELGGRHHRRSRRPTQMVADENAV